MTAAADAFMGIFGFKRVEGGVKTDRELLELAGRAIGRVLKWKLGFHQITLPPSVPYFEVGGLVQYWNPLKDYVDAMRLAVKIGLIIDVRYGCKPGAFTVEACYWPTDYTGPYMSVSETSEDLLSAICRAIVRAAADIGAAL